MTVFVPEEVLTLRPAQTLEHIRGLLADADPNVDTRYARWWAADGLTLMGRYREAVEIYQPPSLERASLQTERLLSLKVAAGLPYTAADALALLGPRLTTCGREHIGHVRRAAGLLVTDVDEDDRKERLLVWSRMSPKRPYQVYSGSAAGYHASKGLGLTHYEFSKAAHFVNYCRTLARKAENMVREDAGLPRVGEGWLSETRLFYELRDAFPEQTVEQHASPEWLGRQHLDVYLPEIAVGVEFQGAQHDGPVDFFGGPEAYEALQKRDARKLRLCKQRGVELVYVRPGYNLEPWLPKSDAGHVSAGARARTAERWRGAAPRPPSGRYSCVGLVRGLPGLGQRRSSASW